MEVRQEVRSLQKLGGSLALYLPKDWCDENGLEKGSKVVVRYAGRALVVEAGESERREATVDLDAILEGDLKYILISLYVLGFDRIRLLAKKRISLPTRRFVLSLLSYTPGYEIVEEGENFVDVAIIREVSDPVEALLRELNSVSTVFRYSIEALERVPDIPSEYVDAVEELDSEVDRAWFEVERALYKAADRPHSRLYGVRILVPLLLVSRYLERLTDHLVQLIREVYEARLQQPDLALQVRDLSAAYHEVAEVFKSVVSSRESVRGFDPVVKLVNFIESKKSFRRSIVPRLRREGGILAAYHVMRIYDYITDIAEVTTNVIIDNFYR